MAPKHPASDTESEDANSPKRVRTTQASTSQDASQSNGRDDADVEMDATGQAGEQSEEEEEPEDEQEGEEEQRRTEARLKAMQRKKKGTIGMAGIIEQVDLENFMNHRLCTVKFGPQINFIVGNNGSGKSAILTAITLALGGTAKLTNRGSKTASFVHEKASSAKVTIRLKNQGSEAFLPDVYGKSIIIERTLRANGGGAYKLMDWKRVVVDTKKATLDAMMDHFGVQVDNPMTVLSQDQSRQFLTSASAKDKYHFFLRGTQLHQLTEEYEAIQANVEQMDDALRRKKQILPELREAYIKAKERAREATAAINQQEKLESLKEELVWSYVDENEEAVRAGQGHVETEKGKIIQTEEQIKKYETKKNEAEVDIRDLEDAQKESTNNIEQFQPELDSVSEEVEHLRSLAKRHKDNTRQASQTMTRLRQQITSLDQEIAFERKKLERDIEAEQRPILARIAELQIQLAEAENANDTSPGELETLDEQRRELSEKLELAKSSIYNAQSAADNIKRQINQAKAAKGNAILAYGNGFPRLMQDIARTRFNDKVVGPIGTTVKLLHPEYARVIESYFAQTLNAFVVTNEQDRKTLFALLMQNKVREVPIIVTRYDDRFFDEVASGEPDKELLTVRRALQWNDRLAEQAAITALKTEKSVLVKERWQGDELLRRNPRNVMATYSANMFQLKIDGGNSSTITMPDHHSSRLNPDNSGQIRALEEEEQIALRDIEKLRREKSEIDHQLADIHQNKIRIERSLQDSRRRIGTLQREIQTQQGKLRQDEGIDIVALEGSREEQQSELNNVEAQFTAAEEKYASETANLSTLVKQKKGLTDQIKASSDLIGKIQNKLESAVRKRVEAVSAISQYQVKLDQTREKLVKLEERCQSFVNDLQHAFEQASKVCERPVVEKRKTPAKLQSDIEAIRRALKERERRQGASVETIMQELKTRKDTLAEAQHATKQLQDLIFHLSESVQARIIRWADFRDQIATGCRMQFLFHLANRGYTGRLVFDHEKSNLHVRVQTEDVKSHKKEQSKDSKSLSGGEKSFSTVCLLLSMWQAVGCPIRCLDEFDVFMDAVNRRVAMRMMVDTAKAANGVQFLLITPQDMGSVNFGPEVRISKLDDPNRNQGNLAMGRA